MAKVEVKVIQSNVDKLLDQITQGELARRARNVIDELNKTAPVADGQHSFSDGTAHLKDSFRVGFTTDHGKLVIRIFSDKVNSRGENISRIITTGSRPHVIAARSANHLAFQWIKNNVFVITPQVNHPGTAANDFIRKALIAAFDR